MNERTRTVRTFLRGSVGNLGTTATGVTVLTCPGLTYARLDTIVANNPSGGTLLLTVYLIPAAGTGGTTNELASVVSILTHASAVITPGAVMGPGDILAAKGDSAGLNIWVSAEVVEPPAGT